MHKHCTKHLPAALLALALLFAQPAQSVWAAQSEETGTEPATSDAGTNEPEPPIEPEPAETPEDDGGEDGGEAGRQGQPEPADADAAANGPEADGAAPPPTGEEPGEPDAGTAPAPTAAPLSFTQLQVRWDLDSITLTVLDSGTVHVYGGSGAVDEEVPIAATEIMLTSPPAVSLVHSLIIDGSGYQTAPLQLILSLQPFITVGLAGAPPIALTNGASVRLRTAYSVALNAPAGHPGIGVPPAVRWNSPAAGSLPAAAMAPPASAAPRAKAPAPSPSAAMP